MNNVFLSSVCWILILDPWVNSISNSPNQRFNQIKKVDIAVAIQENLDKKVEVSRIIIETYYVNTHSESGYTH